MSRSARRLVAIFAAVVVLGPVARGVAGAQARVGFAATVAPRAQAPASDVAFRDATAEAGLADWSSRYGEPVDKQTILETMGPGTGLFDGDGDGYVDAYLLTGPGAGGNRFFRGFGDGGFSPVPAAAGLAVDGWSYGVAAADYDNDGFADLYVTTFGANNLLRSNGDGTFSDVTDATAAAWVGWSTGAAWADVDLDGWLDLLVANYVVIDPATVPAPGSGPFCTWKHLDVPCGPRGMRGGAAALFQNRGDGGFELSPVEGLESDAFYGLGVVWGDFDDDGYPDAYIADDQTPNRLFHNDKGVLAETGELSGAAYSEDGRPQAGMGTDWGDFDADGNLDIFVTNFADESNTLYQNVSGGFFVDATLGAKLALPSFRYLAWGTSFQDFDSDGDLDLFVANGHVYPQVDTRGLVDTYPQANQLFVSEGTSFVEWSAGSGDGLAVPAVSRGAAFADADLDGDVDVLVGNVDGPPTLLLNELDQGNWLRVRLRGREGNRDAVGARVTVRASGAPPLVAEVKAGHSYLSQSWLDLHFGLGDSEDAVVEVRWPRPAGPAAVVESVPAGSLVVIVEGGGHRIVSQASEQQERGDVLVQGREAAARGDLRAAIELLERAAAAAPDDPEILFHLSQVRLRAGDLEAAANDLRRAQELAGRFNPSIAFQLGVALMRAHDYDGARAEFVAVLELQPDAPKPRLNLGWIAMQERQSAVAVAHFEEVVARTPGAGLAHYYMGVIHNANGRFDEAAVAYEQALAAQPGLHEARLALGRLALDAGRLAEARALFERVAADRPDLAEAKFQLGLLEMREGDVSAAVGQLERAVALDREHQGARYNLGLAYARTGRSVDAGMELETFAALRAATAQHELEELRAATTTRAEALYRDGLAAMERGDAAAAGEAFGEAIEAAGDAATAAMFLGLGAALLSQDMVQEASTELEKAIIADTNLAEAYRLLAEVYEKLGKTSEAERARAEYQRIMAKRRSGGR